MRKTDVIAALKNEVRITAHLNWPQGREYSTFTLRGLCDSLAPAMNMTPEQLKEKVGL